MAKDNKTAAEKFDDIPHERADPRPDFSKPPPRKQLPKELQDTLNDDEKLWEVMYEGKAEDTTDTSIRYAAYATRIRTLMLSAQRYVAYTSDIGESFRPIAHPYLVKGAYGVSWAYLIGDVSNEGYKAYCRNQKTLHPENYIEIEDIKPAAPEVPTTAGGIFDSIKEVAKNATSTEGIKTGGQMQIAPGLVPAIEDYRAVMAQRAIFQAVASMGLPAFTIHSIVRYSGRALKDAKNKTIRTWGPIGVRELSRTTLNLILTPCSWVSRPCHSCHTCSTNPWSMRRNGSFTMRSRHLAGRKRWRDDRLRGRRS
jgi:fission process protein 1